MSWPTTKKSGATADLNAIGASLRSEPAAVPAGSQPATGRAITGSGARALRTTGETGPVMKAVTVERVGRWPAPVGRVRGLATETGESVLTVGTVLTAVSACNVGTVLIAVSAAAARPAGTVLIAVSVRNVATVNVETARTAAKASSAAAANVRLGQSATVASVRPTAKVSTASAGSVRSELTGTAVSDRPAGTGTFGSNHLSVPGIGVRIRRVVGLRRGSDGRQTVQPSTRVLAAAG